MSDNRAVTRKIDDEYELNQLNPVYSKSKRGEASQQEARELLDNVPEKDSVEMRMATMEAIVEDIVEDVAENHNPESDTPLSTEADEAVSGMVDKAILLHLVPSMFRNRVPRIIARVLKKQNPMYNLLSRTAHLVSDAMVRMEDDACVVDEVLEEKPADIGVDIQEEQAVRTGDNEQCEDGATPTIVGSTCAYLARSAVNHRKSTALMCKRIAGPLLSRTIYELRNQLPQSFKDKYGIRI